MAITEFGYLCTRRPADLGTIPSGAKRIERMDGNTVVYPDYRIFRYKPWDIVYYDHELSAKDIERFELTPKYDFTDGLLTEFFQIREQIKQGLLAVDFDDVIAYNDENKEFDNYGMLLLNTIRYSPLDEIDWCALYIMLTVTEMTEKTEPQIEEETTFPIRVGSKDCGFLICYKCGKYIGYGLSHCTKCGRKIDWRYL